MDKETLIKVLEAMTCNSHHVAEIYREMGDKAGAERQIWRAIGIQEAIGVFTNDKFAQRMYEIFMEGKTND